MISLQKNKSYLRTTTNQYGTFAMCVKCRHMVNIEAFNPDIADPECDEDLIDWFEAFRKYQPIMMRALNTTISELAEVWGIGEQHINHALKYGRILVDDKGDWYINAKPWEPQSICYECRHPKSEVYCEDPITGYLKLLSAA